MPVAVVVEHGGGGSRVAAPIDDHSSDACTSSLLGMNSSDLIVATGEAELGPGVNSDPNRGLCASYQLAYTGEAVLGPGVSPHPA